jgi:hypothetical protein
MRVLDHWTLRIALWLALLPLGGLVCGCHSMPKPLFLASGPSWHVQEGQALWRPGHGRPELAGDLLLASDDEGRCLIQFAKTPLSFVLAQTTRTNWLIQFPPVRMGFSGRGKPPTRFGWLYLHAALSGEPVVPPFRFERETDGRWQFENTKTGETLSGFLAP